MSDHEHKIPKISFEKIETDFRTETELDLHKEADSRTETELEPHKPEGNNGEGIPDTNDMNKEVVVVDIQMPFALMVGFMTKWTLAAILAAIIICATFFIGVLVAGGFMYGLTGENIFETSKMWQLFFNAKNN